MKFDKPTLITITAPTCSGKSFLLNALAQKGFSRIISTTTRSPRDDEIPDVDYFFITVDRSKELEIIGAFAELVEYRGTRYGVTKQEMENKMSGEFAPVVILEPQGLAIYEKYCREHDWAIFKIYVFTNEETLIERLNQRTVNDVSKLYRDGNHHTKKIITTHTDRLLSITGDERRWQGTNNWDAIVSGEDVKKAIADIEQGIKWRNHRDPSVI